MKISSKTRYGLRACFILAIRFDSIVPIGELVKGTSVSQKYLEKILSMLIKEKVVSTVRGAQGGYRLTAPPDSITVGQIFRILEDNLEISDCISGECKDGYCPNRNILKKLHDSMNQVLDQCTLQNLLEENTCKASHYNCRSEEHT